MSNNDESYRTLRSVLDRAYNQAAVGKGAMRHGQGQAFEHQPMQTISRLLGSTQGMCYQAVKKIQESQRLAHPAAVEELLGAINYLAGAVIFLEATPTDTAKAAQSDHDPKEVKGSVLEESVLFSNYMAEIRSAKAQGSAAHSPWCTCTYCT